jgi:hypothetical protein
MRPPIRRKEMGKEKENLYEGGERVDTVVVAWYSIAHVSLVTIYVTCTSNSPGNPWPQYRIRNTK